MKFLKKKTLSEKTDKASIKLGKELGLDPTDIKNAYAERENDLIHHRKQLTNNHWNTTFGLIFSAAGIGSGIDRITDTHEIQQSANQSTETPTVSIGLGETGSDLFFAFAGAALIAYGMKGNRAIKKLIHNKVGTHNNSPTNDL